MFIRKIFRHYKYFFISLFGHFSIAIIMAYVFSIQKQPQVRYSLSVYTLIPASMTPSPREKRSKREAMKAMENTFIPSLSPLAKNAPREGGESKIHKGKLNKSPPVRAEEEQSDVSKHERNIPLRDGAACLLRANGCSTKPIYSTPKLPKKSFSELIKLLHQAIALKEVYPDSALMLQESGSVTLGFLLFPDGHLAHISILKSSGFESLDRAACDALMQIAPVKEASLYLQRERFFSIDIIFR